MTFQLSDDPLNRDDRRRFAGDMIKKDQPGLIIHLIHYRGKDLIFINCGKRDLSYP